MMAKKLNGDSRDGGDPVEELGWRLIVDNAHGAFAMGIAPSRYLDFHLIAGMQLAIALSDVDELAGARLLRNRTEAMVEAVFEANGSSEPSPDGEVN